MRTTSQLQPRQRRSRETLRKILDGFEAALEEGTFEEITVQDICGRAGCSVGTFYGRVESKEGLLELLRERVYGEVEVGMERFFDPETAAIRPLRESLRDQCEALVDLHMRRRGVIRAVIVQARRRSEFAEFTKAFNDAMLRRVARTWLARREEITHPDPILATEQAALMAAGYLREAIIFGELWPVERKLDRDELVASIHEMLTGVLTGGTPRRD